jgi:hypothetical protein
VDGCDLRCAARATEQYSGKPAAGLVVTDVVAECGIGQVAGRRRLNEAGKQAVEETAVRVADMVDTLLEKRWRLTAFSMRASATRVMNRT